MKPVLTIIIKCEAEILLSRDVDSLRHALQQVRWFLADSPELPRSTEIKVRVNGVHTYMITPEDVKLFDLCGREVDPLLTDLGEGEPVYVPTQYYVTPGGTKRYPVGAEIWFRESTQEWVLELTGTLNDTHFTYHHTQPADCKLEEVAALEL